MAKITRKNQKIFGGSLAAPSNIAVFGSLAAAAPAYSLDPDAIQSAEYLLAWAAALVNAPGGNASPALQDMNALFFLLSRQMAYVMQDGIPEWNAETTYYIDSFCKLGGVVYIAKTDNNLNKDPVTQTNDWKTLASTLGTATKEAKAWVSFVGATGVILSAYNVATVARTAAGSYVLNFTTNLADALYAWAGSCGTAAGGAWQAGDDNTVVGGVNGRAMVKSTSQLSVFCWDRVDGTTQDPGVVSVMIFGN